MVLLSIEHGVVVVVGGAQKALVKATRKAFRSFRFGLDRP